MVTQQRKLQHLYLRAGFGQHAVDITKNSSLTIEKAVDALFADSVTINSLLHMENPLGEGRVKKEASNLKALLMILRSQKELKSMSVSWIKKMTTEKAQLREKMTLFWHNHFATHVPFSYLAQDQNNMLRKHALGKFGDLLHAVAKDPAMIVYLNNQQNKKNAPNENFAREVMELFTLGVGNYTEKDIKEAARAFTGWQINKMGEFTFNEKDHDFGEKTVLGKTGKLKGEDVIDVLLSKKETALFVTRKIYREFVNYDVDEKQVALLADDFFASGYDISKLMRSILTANWFYDEKNIGSKIASPVELLVRYYRTINIQPIDDKMLVISQNLLGQQLFHPPNVAGWKGGKAWIDTSSLLLRMRLPLAMFGYMDSDESGKDEYEDMAMVAKAEKKSKKNKFVCTANFAKLSDAFVETETEKLSTAMLNSFLQTDISPAEKKVLLEFADKGSKQKQVQSLAIHIMAMPEYQLI
jgi:uncharacterized protein (DUF1800 family)